MPPRKKDIFTLTKHLDCNQLRKIQKSDCFKNGIPQTLQIVTMSASLSYAFRGINRFMASDDVSPSKLTGPPRTKIVEENIDTVRNLVEEKPNSSISNPSNSWAPTRGGARGSTCLPPGISKLLLLLLFISVIGYVLLMKFKNIIHW